MIYGILCAMDEEFGILENEIAQKEIVECYSRRFIKGKIGENEVVCVVSRIGKVAASLTTAILIEKFKVDAIVFCGIAGGLSENVKIGDIVIGSECVQHDFYLSDTDFFRIPLLNISNIPCDKALSEKCKAAADKFCTGDKSDEINSFFSSLNIKNPTVHTGIIASGDQFIQSNDKRNWIKDNISGVMCCEMEGAAVAQACYESGVPCAIIRVISDSADCDAEISFDKFVSAASLYSSAIIKNLLK